MKIRFSDEEYRTVHDHAPRGRGMWMFTAIAERSGAYLEIPTMQAYGTLTQAKAEVKNQIRRLDVPSNAIVYVEVAP